MNPNAYIAPPSLTRAILMAISSLRYPTVWFHLLWPALLAFVLWVVGFMLLWSAVGSELTSMLQTQMEKLPAWFVAFGIVSMMSFVAQAFLATLLLPLIYMVFTLIFSVWVLPLLQPILAKKHYPTLYSKTGITLGFSITNTVRALIIFMFWWSVSFFFIIIPGATFLLHLWCSAKLNKDSFTVDALSGYASMDELITLREQHSTSLLALGALSSVLVYVPFINTIATAFVGLCFVHYSFSALAYHRINHREKMVKG